MEPGKVRINGYRIHQSIEFFFRRAHQRHLALQAFAGTDYSTRPFLFHLAPRGVLAVEVGAGQAPAVVSLFEGSGFAAIELRRDYARIERVVSGVLHPR